MEHRPCQMLTGRNDARIWRSGGTGFTLLLRHPDPKRGKVLGHVGAPGVAKAPEQLITPEHPIEAARRQMIKGNTARLVRCWQALTGRCLCRRSRAICRARKPGSWTRPKAGVSPSSRRAAGVMHQQATSGTDANMSSGSVLLM